MVPLEAPLDGLARFLEKHDIAGAIKMAEASSRLEARVALVGLQSIGRGFAAVEEVMSSRWLRKKWPWKKI